MSNYVYHAEVWVMYITCLHNMQRWLLKINTCIHHSQSCNFRCSSSQRLYRTSQNYACRWQN